MTCRLEEKPTIGPSELANMPGKADSSVRHIAFICFALGEGQDGVGDYCRRLAHSLVKLGVRCDILAVADPLCDEPTEELIGAASGFPAIRGVRLPASLALRRRSALASEVLERWQPQWVSLQFVSYGFNRKGIAYREPFWLPRPLRPYRSSVMMHELWLGIPPNQGLWHRLVGAAQRTATLYLLRRLKPMAIATSNPYYQSVLADHGVRCALLPLISNIPVTTESAEPWLGDAIRKAGGAGLPDIATCRDRVLLIGMFGTISTDWRVEPLLRDLGEFGRRTGRQVVIVSAGNPGRLAADSFRHLGAHHPDIHFVLIGRRSRREISQFFNTIDIGLSSYPYYVLGRSGSVAAMLEHGLPVIATRGDERIASMPAGQSPVDRTFAEMVWHADSQLVDRLLRLPARHPRPDWTNEVARRFLDHLERAAEAASPHR